MIKARSNRFHQCLAKFRMLTVELSSEMRFFRHLSIHALDSPLFRKYMSHKGHIFSKRSELYADFKNRAKNSTIILFLS